MTASWLRRPSLRWREPILAIAAVVAVAVGLFTWVQFFRRVPPPTYASDEERFLYGSIGTEVGDSVPYWIWLVLPRIFPEYLPGPGGYASLGAFARDGHEMPIGFSKVTIGYDRVGTNCALCHTARYPQRQTAETYAKFLVACASDPRFTADTLLEEIAKNYSMPLGERLAFRFGIIPSTRRALLRVKEQSAWNMPHRDVRGEENSSVRWARHYLAGSH